MSNIERLYYAVGDAAYAIADADGKLRKEEKEKLHELLQDEFGSYHAPGEVTKIIFGILRKEAISSLTAFAWALKEMHLNSHNVSDALKNHFVAVLQKVAEIFPPATQNEKLLLDRFIKELLLIEGDPVHSRAS